MPRNTHNVIRIQPVEYGIMVIPQVEVPWDLGLFTKLVLCIHISVGVFLKHSENPECYENTFCLAGHISLKYIKEK